MTNDKIENDEEHQELRKEIIKTFKEALSTAKTREEAEQIKAQLHSELDKSYKELKSKKSSSNTK